MSQTSPGGRSADYEVALVNRVVRAAHEGERLPDEVQALMEELVYARGWDERTDVNVGVVVPSEDLPAWTAESAAELRDYVFPWAALDGEISDDRFSELVEGGTPTADEWLIVARWFVEHVQENSDYADIYWGAGAIRLADEDGRTAWLMQYLRGFSFTSVEQELEGPFPTLEEARAAVAHRGIISPEEVRIEDFPGA